MVTIPPHERRTGLLVPVAVDSRVEAFRQRYLASTVARRLPPHVTVLFPFARGEDVADRYGSELGAHFASFEPFDAELTGIGAFADVVWLAPAPRERFLDLLAETCARFPEFPPYEGAVLEPVPHLTIGAPDGRDDVDAIAAAARSELEHGAADHLSGRQRRPLRGTGGRNVHPVAAVRARMTDRTVCVSVTVPSATAEEARALALELVPEGFEESESEQTTTLRFYVGEPVVGSIREAFGDVEVVDVEPGWEDAWRAFHQPARVGGLWIGPPWERPAEGDVAIVIDPGRAFGTGAHPTTRLCIELLARAERGSLLDVGCGSGVLSIAAARLGFGPIRAVDNDPVAVETTIANAAVNGVTVEASLADGERDSLPGAALTVANVLLSPVERILARLESGVVITSGYLVSDIPVAAGWRAMERIELDGWAADRFERA